MKKGATKTQVIHVRLSTEAVRNLDHIAKQADRPRAYILHWLIAEEVSRAAIWGAAMRSHQPALLRADCVGI